MRSRRGSGSRASYYYDCSVAYINTTTNMDGVLVKMENPIPNRRKWVNRKNSVLFAHYFFLWIQKKDKNSASQRREDFYVPEGWEYACSIIRIHAIWYLILWLNVTFCVAVGLLFLDVRLEKKLKNERKFSRFSFSTMEIGLFLEMRKYSAIEMVRCIGTLTETNRGILVAK